MNDNLKKAIIILGGGFILYWLFKDKGMSDMKKDKKIDTPEVDGKELANKNKANAFIALKAYIDAVNNRENDKALDELNREFAKELKVRVYKRSSDSVIVVSDLKGKVLLENK
jgi:hypothetical protein